MRRLCRHAALAGAACLGVVAAPGAALADPLTGGVLGSVLRGDEFTGPRVLDLVVVGLVIFLVLRLLLGRSRRSGQDQSRPYDRSGPTEPYDGTPPPAPPRPKRDMYTNAQATWDALRSTPSSKTASQSAGQPSAGATPDEEFLAGAKMAYGRILADIAKRDFDDLAGFTTPDFLANLKNSLPLSPPPAPDVLLVEATLAEHREQGSQTVMVVDYKVLIHEKDAPHNTDRFDRWRFVRDNATPGANWLLDAMEQR
ncbi:Tim44 domain-containing protein [Solidesulfovibrio fructosivorans]|uniref:hypothetical protein n=1 Tax=Solidesulfovibrio fructosivorans TaxID=878 RepID=UPI0011801DCB|nr:hypothetical protein [Solidesulfovibrio fructosivorans]